MKRGPKLILAIAFGCIFIFLLFCVRSSLTDRRVDHQRPYRWDAFALPALRFTNATIIEVVAQVNELVAKTSNGAVTQAICLETNLATIEKFSSDPVIAAEMDRLVANYRNDEVNWLNRGACGFETCRYTREFMPKHSLGCELQDVASWAQLDYEEKPDAIHLRRAPSQLECRAYMISPKLQAMAAELNVRHRIRVGISPVVSAFIDVTKVGLWSIDVPTKANGTTGEYRDASVFKYLPEKSILLVIETPEAHKTAELNLRAEDYWVKF